MNKTDLVATVAAAENFRPQSVESVLKALTTAIVENLKAGESVTLPGIGKLVPVDQPERQRRNPRTGEVVTVPAGRKIQFRLSPKLKNEVR